MTRAERYQAAITALREAQTPIGPNFGKGATISRAEAKKRRLDQHAALMRTARLLGTRTALPKVLVESLKNVAH